MGRLVAAGAALATIVAGTELAAVAQLAALVIVFILLLSTASTSPWPAGLRSGHDLTARHE